MLFKLLIQIDNKSYRKCSRKRLSRLVKCKEFRNRQPDHKALEELEWLVEVVKLEVEVELVVD